MPDAAQLLGLARIRVTLAKTVPVADFLRARHVRGEFAGVVDLLRRRRVGHLLRLDEILLAQRVGTDAEFARRDVDQPLDHVGRLRPARAAIGIDRQRVGEGRADARIDGREIVDARQQARAAVGNVGRERREVAAHVGDGFDAQREELVAGVEREFRGGDVVAALRIADEMLGAVGDPLHRALELLRRNGRERIFAERKQLGAEAAAGVRIDHAHLLRRNVEDHLAQDIADAVRPLAAERQREAILGFVVFGNDRAGVEIVGDEPLVDDGQRHGLGRRCKRLVGLFLVADSLFEHQIAGLVRPHQRRAGLERGDRIDHRRHRLPVDGNRFGRVARLLDRIGDDKRDRIADVADFLAGKHFVGRRQRWSTPGSGNITGNLPRSAVSCAVMISRTPGIALAFLVSVIRNFAKACGERSTTACSVPAGV